MSGYKLREGDWYYDLGDGDGEHVDPEDVLPDDELDAMYADAADRHLSRGGDQ